jgi:tRNA (mo5U34)-methyltransferase
MVRDRGMLSSVSDGSRPAADISELLAARDQHAKRMSKARSKVGDGVPWYLYDILGNVIHLDAMLTGENRDLGRLAGGLPVADIGGADGDLAFALEHQWGWQVDMVDTAAANMNGLRGARALRDQLGSSVKVEDIDLDSQFRLPRDHYGLVFLLGILYHLQNPYYTLRALAGVADHCLLSTRVARFAGPERTPIGSLPVAYLVDPRETNNDASNYWMFSPAGLERVVARTGWTVLERHSAGDVDGSDPSSPEHDERMFMLLRAGRL